MAFGQCDSLFAFLKNMVPNSEDASSSGEQAIKIKNKGKGSKMTLNVEKDSEEYRKLRERNNEAVKKSRTRTKLRTQGTLEKVEKLRNENSRLEERIDGLKKELDLLKELFMSHAGMFTAEKMKTGLESWFVLQVPRASSV